MVSQEVIDGLVGFGGTMVIVVGLFLVVLWALNRWL